MGSNQRKNAMIMANFIKELKAVPGEFDRASEKILNDAISVAEIHAKDLTPAVTGDARAKWQTKKAYKVANGFKARLFNNSEYIGYINNGHRMEPHFVPGEWIGNTFEYNPFSKEGVLMGSKTKYVKGKFMLEKASGRAEKHLIKRAVTEIENIKKRYET
jgi:hypothetical protein|nr:MAG TPA: putative tail-component [Caudoviricetes sp.]